MGDRKMTIREYAKINNFEIMGKLTRRPEFEREDRGRYECCKSKQTLGSAKLWDDNKQR